jgi:hypothetical protein
MGERRNQVISFGVGPQAAEGTFIMPSLYISPDFMSIFSIFFPNTTVLAKIDISCQIQANCNDLH